MFFVGGLRWAGVFFSSWQCMIMAVRNGIFFSGFFIVLRAGKMLNAHPPVFDCSCVF